MFVLDASVTMAWCFSDEVSAYTEGILERLRETGARVPAIWPLEVVNVLLVGERRQRLTAAQSERFLDLLRSLPIEVADGSLRQAAGSVLAVARTRTISAYDAAYLDLAMTLGLPLATTDNRLIAAAQAVGIAIYQP